MAPKSEQDVVNDFNEIVNMTADELETFLKTEGSESTGYQKDDGSGESIGHESGRKIVDILKRNPDKDPSKYTEEDKEHMRRVVSYCKRHLAQEGKLKETKTPEELEKTKSTRSLKNWGHDPMKTLSKSDQPQSSKPTSKKAEKPKSKGKPEAAEKEETEKPKSKGRDRPPNSKKEEAKSPEKPTTEEAEVGEKRGRGRPPNSKKDESPKKATEEGNGEGEKRGRGRPPKKTSEEGEKSEKPPSKKAKTTTEGTRKPPSRGAKKA
ncbi:hypothetical protein I204_07651 [Kwoniella mangroviensis CBS 8886]|nr:hypothetical protein I204_07651 [Kwoniella mangroviensis CBS 8886]